MVVDWDVHHGNGTNAALHDSRRRPVREPAPVSVLPRHGTALRRRLGGGGGVLAQPAAARRVGRGGVAVADGARRGSGGRAVPARAGAGVRGLRRPPRRPARRLHARDLLLRRAGPVVAPAGRARGGSGGVPAGGRLRPRCALVARWRRRWRRSPTTPSRARCPPGRWSTTRPARSAASGRSSYFRAPTTTNSFAPPARSATGRSARATSIDARLLGQGAGGAPRSRGRTGRRSRPTPPGALVTSPIVKPCALQAAGVLLGGARCRAPRSAPRPGRASPRQRRRGIVRSACPARSRWSSSRSGQGLARGVARGLLAAGRPAGDLVLGVAARRLQGDEDADHGEDHHHGGQHHGDLPARRPAVLKADAPAAGQADQLPALDRGAAGRAAAAVRRAASSAHQALRAGSRRRIVERLVDDASRARPR